MSNGFTNLPSSLLGNVAIGGALSVAGGLTVGASPNIVRVGNFTGYGPGVSGNLAFDAATRDNAGVSAALEALGANANIFRRKFINSGGTAMDLARVVAVLAQPVSVVNNNDATERTLFSVNLRAGIVGANSLLIVRTTSIVGAGSGGTDTVRLKYGGTTLLSTGVTAYNGMFWEWRVMLQNALNSQRVDLMQVLTAANPTLTNGTPAADFSVDGVLTVTHQGSSAIGNNTWFGCDVQLLNSVGPV